MFLLWLKASLVRALKTVCQTAAGILAAGTVFTDIDWKIMISTSLLSGLASLLTSIAGLPEVDAQKEAAKKN
jgi:hypothetical protein